MSYIYTDRNEIVIIICERRANPMSVLTHMQALCKNNIEIYDESIAVTIAV